MEHTTKEGRAHRLPWFAMPAEAWPAIASQLVRPWGTGAMLTDLAYWQDLEWRTRGRQRRPARRRLVSRWGVSDWMVRRMLRSSVLWADPRKETNQRPTSDQPATNHSQKVEPAISAKDQPATNQRPTQEPPHARRTQAQAQAQKSTRAARSSFVGWDEAVDLWRELGPKTASGTAARRRPTKSRGVGRALGARLRSDGVADVLRVIRWAHESDDERARFLRGARGPRDVPDRAKVSLATLMRPSNFETYRDMASQWVPCKAAAVLDPAADVAVLRDARPYWAASND